MTPLVKANGAAIPAVGFGTWQLTGKDCQRAVEVALDVGYRHLDTATAYDNEAAVGAGLAASGIGREDVFLTTKVWPDRLSDGAMQRSAEESLKRLGTDYVDLFLIHWPSRDIPLKESIRALNDVQKRGLARHVGVSNFTVGMIDEAVSLSDAPIAVNQVEYHPFLDQSKVMAACRRHGLALTAYCPLARGRVFDSDILADIARTRGRTVSQIATRWLVQQPGVIAIPRTSRPERVSENFQIFDFELTPGEMAAISALKKPDGRVVNNPNFAPVWD